MLNSTKTYLSFDLKDKNSKQYKYCVTVLTNYCKSCKKDTYVITQGPDLNDEPWIQYCLEHVTEIAAKKQHCNVCNKKASIIDNIPKLCAKCYEYLYNNNVEMYTICKYPVLAMEECNCKFCKIR
jgi:hypothetical protein